MFFKEKQNRKYEKIKIKHTVFEAVVFLATGFLTTFFLAAGFVAVVDFLAAVALASPAGRLAAGLA